MASAVMDLMILLGEDGGTPLHEKQVTMIQSGIRKNMPELSIPFSHLRLCARFAQQQVAAQKKLLKDLEKAATFKRNRKAYLLAQRSMDGGTSGMRM
jgi:hypothetical protein